MLRTPARTSTQPRDACAGASLLVGLGGCSLKHPTANIVTGKQLFVAKCGACHTLARAARPPTSGRTSTTRTARTAPTASRGIQGLVDYWIQYPNSQGVMPGMLFKGQQAQDVAAYVAAVAAVPGRTPARSATRSPPTTQHKAAEKNGCSRSTPTRPAS